MRVGDKVLLPNDERGEILRLIDNDWQAIVLTEAGRKVGCHLIRLRPAASGDTVGGAA